MEEFGLLAKQHFIFNPGQISEIGFKLNVFLVVLFTDTECPKSVGHFRMTQY